MPTILVRDISEKAHKALKLRAKQNGTSVSAEMRVLVESVVEPKKEKGLGTLLQELGRKYGPLPEYKRDPAPMEPVSFE